MDLLCNRLNQEASCYSLGDCTVLILDISIPHQMSPGDLFSYKKGRERKVR